MLFARVAGRPTTSEDPRKSMATSPSVLVFGGLRAVAKGALGAWLCLV